MGHAGHGHHHHNEDQASVFGRLTEESYDQRYAATDALWSGNPNPQLVTEAAGLTPGLALDAGCGEGADALWLAARGWKVTAVDFSSVALARGAALAGQQDPAVAGRTEWLQRDLNEWAPPKAAYDLVSAQFLQMPKEPREKIFRALADAVAPGGTLLIVGHDPADHRAEDFGAAAADVFFTADETAAAILAPGQWEDIRSETRRRETHNSPDADRVDHDAVLLARKRG